MTVLVSTLTYISDLAKLLKSIYTFDSIDTSWCYPHLPIERLDQSSYYYLQSNLKHHIKYYPNVGPRTLASHGTKTSRG